MRATVPRRSASRKTRVSWPSGCWNASGANTGIHAGAERRTTAETRPAARGEPAHPHSTFLQSAAERCGRQGQASTYREALWAAPLYLAKLVDNGEKAGAAEDSFRAGRRIVQRAAGGRRDHAGSASFRLIAALGRGARGCRRWLRESASSVPRSTKATRRNKRIQSARTPLPARLRESHISAVSHNGSFAGH